MHPRLARGDHGERYEARWAAGNGKSLDDLLGHPDGLTKPQGHFHRTMATYKIHAVSVLGDINGEEI